MLFLSLAAVGKLDVTGRHGARRAGPPLVVHAEVQAAIDAGEPVVALESTIITHGMPYPDNLHTARAVEEAVREAGAVPATVALLDGVCHVGLATEELTRLAQLGRERVAKCSRRDLAAVMARRGHGATTVSATMLLAHLAGVPVFVTGGIGGVHRGGEASMDVSADLTELSRTPVCVVCAGVKSILDIPRTLEVLETNGVAVAALGARLPSARRRGSRLPAALATAPHPLSRPPHTHPPHPKFKGPKIDWLASRLVNTHTHTPPPHPAARRERVPGLLHPLVWLRRPAHRGKPARGRCPRPGSQMRSTHA